MRRGPRFISPAIQREGIEAWAAARHARLLDVFCKLDESGGRADRPLLERAIEQIETGASQGLVVWKVDRFSRSVTRSPRQDPARCCATPGWRGSYAPASNRMRR
jgi:DNA invertase Pin-like site-specific DNA recombinase